MMYSADQNSILNRVQSANAYASVFLSNPSSTNADQLNDELKFLIENTKSILPTSRISPIDSRIKVFAVNTQAVIADANTGALTRSRLYVLLYNLCIWNVKVRRLLSGVNNMCSAICQGLQHAISEQLGPQNLIDILRLLQLLTYEHNFVVGSWTFDLIKYLHDEILKEPELEWLPYCVAILCNLLGRSKTVCTEFKQKYYRKQLPQRLMKLLEHDSRLVVVCTLLIIGRLETAVTSKVFSAENVSQTIMCGFNVLSIPDHVLTVQYAVDFLKSVLINDSNPVTQLNDISRSYPTFDYFEASISTLASLLVVLDARSEECAKIYELLLNFCSIPDLKSPVCSVILKAPPPQKRCTRPTQAVIRTAEMVVEESPLLEIPVYALKLLNFLEAIADSELDSFFEKPDVLISVVEVNVKTDIETASEAVVYQCQRISESLKLAQTLASDKEVNEKLKSVLTATLCAHINESQLVSNSSVVYLCSPTNAQNQQDVPEWSKHAVSIPIELIKLLSILKDHSRLHKDLYWRMLEEDRLLPFIACALLSGSTDQIYGALNLITQCAQNQRFPWMTLVGHVRNCTRSLTNASYFPDLKSVNGRSSTN